MAEKPALLMLSGGIDSTYVAYKTLAEGRPLHIHHIHLINREGRVEAEKRAVQRVLAWLRRNGLTNFTYTENTFDYGSIRFLVKDYWIYSFIAGVILSDPRNKEIGSMLHPRHSDAFNLRPGQSFEQAAQRASSALEGLPSLLSRRDIKIEYPILELDKAGVIDACPGELLKLAWYCRRPIRMGSTYQTCNECFTCRQVSDGLARKRRNR
ncbi:hypothetical protein [Amycolatopsis sp. DSM 110486]|uniref:hypothetical protein n=1 Tax=Amycolatopsis sp. DSM 110486 TaxID=2865832 RepID=UPI001C69D79C|nr:hypothetical protein [Amycolatopsis sp. DSM 110486]QYN17604.1 hypothetical protein K1T34_32995 [Amycolatopsis sp. DSM 110486]